MSETASTITRQAPGALLALVQHINDQDLGTPLSIYPPSTAAPYFSVTVASYAVDAWVAAGMDVDDVKTSLMARPGYERVEIIGRVHGLLPVQLVAHRRVELTAVPA